MTAEAPRLDVDLRRETDILRDVLESAGTYLLNRRDAPGLVSRKLGTDIVTEADLGAEQQIIDALSRAFPDDGILAEESGVAAGSSYRRWVIDPLDGTVNFATGLPYFGVSVSLEVEDEPVLGGIRHVTARETYLGGIGVPAHTTSGGTLRGSSQSALADVVAAVQLPDTAWTGAPDLTAAVFAMRGHRITGSVALDLSLCASGVFDLCLYRRTPARWDWSAGEAILGATPGCTVEVVGRMDGMELVAAGGADAVAVLAERLHHAGAIDGDSGLLNG